MLVLSFDLKEIMTKRNKNKKKKNKAKPIDRNKVFDVKKHLQLSDDLPYTLLLNWKPSEIYHCLDEALKDLDIEKYLKSKLDNCALGNLGKSESDIVLPATKELAIIFVILKKYRARLANFERIYHQFYRSYLNNNYEQCYELINYTKSEFGYSKWVIAAEFLILQELFGIEKQKKYLKDISENELVDNRIKVLSYFNSLRVEKEISWHRYHGNHVAKTLTRSRKVNNLSDSDIQFYEFNIADFEVSDLINSRTLLWQEKQFSVYDLYLATLRIGVMSFLKGPKFELFSTYKSLLKSTFGYFNNAALERLAVLFGQTKGVLNSTDHSFLLALEDYTIGDYRSDNIRNCLNSNDKYQIDAYELIARSYNEDEINDQYSLDVPFVKYFYDIANKNESFSNSYDLILKEALKTLGTGEASDFCSFLDREFLDESGANFHYHDLFTYVINAKFNPRILKIVNRSNFVSSTHGTALKLVTFDLFESIKNGNVEKQKDVLPGYRYLKYSGAILYKQKKYFEAIDKFEAALVKSRNIDRFSLLKYLANCYLVVDEWQKCLELVVNEYLENFNVISIFPIPELIKKILTIGVFDNDSSINATIAYDFCIKYFNTSKEIEEARESSFEDYLDFIGVEKPSELSIESVPTSKAKLKYFLEYICLPGIMSVSEHFKNNQELLDERILVLKKLINCFKELDSETYKNEIKDRTLELLVSKGVRESEDGLIRINELGVIEEINKDIVEDYRRYLSLKAVVHYQEDDFTQLLLDLLRPENESISILKSMAEKARDVFLLSINGLDVNLSTDMRHGTIENVLKRSLKESKLMVMFANHTPDFSSVNLLNLDSRQKDVLSNVLIKLSWKLDVLVKFILKKIVRVKDYSTKKDGWFYIDLNKYDVLFLRSQLNKTTEVDEASKYFIDLFWSKIEECLESVKEKFNSDIRKSINRIFGDAIRELEVSGEFNGTEQFQCLKLAQTESQNDVNRILNWFKRAEGKYAVDFEASLIPEIAKKIVGNYYPGLILKMELKDLNKSSISGKHLRDLTTIMVNCLTNAVKHSKLGNDSLLVKVNLFEEKERLVIDVRNNISDEVNISEVEKKLTILKNEILEKNKTNYLRTEGRTGIHRIVKIVKNEFKGDGVIDFGLKKRIFYVKMYIGVDYVRVVSH